FSTSVRSMSTLTSRRCHKTAWKSQKQATSVKSGRHRPFFFAKRRSLPDRARIPARYIVVGIVGLTRLTTLQHASVCLFQIIERRIPIGAVVQFLLEYFQSGLAIVNNLRPGSDPNSAAQIRTLPRNSLGPAWLFNVLCPSGRFLRLWWRATAFVRRRSQT